MSRPSLADVLVEEGAYQTFLPRSRHPASTSLSFHSSSSSSTSLHLSRLLARVHSLRIVVDIVPSFLPQSLPHNPPPTISALGIVGEDIVRCAITQRTSCGLDLATLLRQRHLSVTTRQSYRDRSSSKVPATSKGSNNTSLLAFSHNRSTATNKSRHGSLNVSILA